MRIVCVFVLLGVLLAAASAIGPAVFARCHSHAVFAERPEGSIHGQLSQVHHSWATTWVFHTRSSFLAPTEVPDVVEQCTVVAGWPWRCMRGETTGQSSEQMGVGLKAIHDSIHGRGGSIRARVIPSQILVGGFAANTAVYSVTMWLFHALQRAIMNAHRRRRGVCVHCRYDVSHRDTVLCPECGRNPSKKN